jgi:hypothetical protein
MIDPDHLATADPLGLGGLLVDARRLERVAADDASHRLVDAMLAGAELGLRCFADQPDLRLPAARRLGFRELGLAIGLGEIERMQQRAPELRAGAARRIAQISRFVPLRAQIETFWRDPAHRAAPSWRGHEDINDVMLATALVPGALGE